MPSETQLYWAGGALALGGRAGAPAEAAASTAGQLVLAAQLDRARPGGPGGPAGPDGPGGPASPASSPFGPSAGGPAGPGGPGGPACPQPATTASWVSLPLFSLTMQVE